LGGAPAWDLCLPIPCTAVGACPTGACPRRSRCDAARAYGDTTGFFADFEFFEAGAGTLAAGFGAAAAAVGFAVSAEAAMVAKLAAINIAAAPYLRKIRSYRDIRALLMSN
jgi:hypothetical protein